MYIKLITNHSHSHVSLFIFNINFYIRKHLYKRPQPFLLFCTLCIEDYLNENILHLWYIFRYLKCDELDYWIFWRTLGCLLRQKGEDSAFARLDLLLSSTTLFCFWLLLSVVALTEYESLSQYVNIQHKYLSPDKQPSAGIDTLDSCLLYSSLRL